nr:MAG TPA: hypothetical protein [Caudoviricetes sp.]
MVNQPQRKDKTKIIWFKWLTNHLTGRKVGA